MEFSTYIYTGLVVTFGTLWFYRRDGQTQNPHELYWAALGPFLWPLQVCKFLLDRIVEKVQLDHEKKFYDFLDSNMERLQVVYNRYVAEKLAQNQKPDNFLEWARKSHAHLRSLPS